MDGLRGTAQNGMTGLKTKLRRLLFLCKMHIIRSVSTALQPISIECNARLLLVGGQAQEALGIFVKILPCHEE